MALFAMSCNTPKAAQAPVSVVVSPPANTTQTLQEKKDYSGTYPDEKAGQYDNGKMWTFAYPPKEYFAKTYHFNASDEWLETVRKSALRFATYCTASFVSEDGLVMTNHHCGRESVTEVTKEGEDLPTNGFYAQTLADERPVPGLFVDQLVSMRDVTQILNDAENAGATPQEKAKLRRDKITELTTAGPDEKDMTYQLHSFYNGSIYQVFGYKRYNDVRLVMAPETALGFFGGDPDNFTYPRYCLDYTFFRVYGEDGKPLKTPYHFNWSADGAAEGEATFVVGNPGTTKRLSTMAQLEYDRDYSVPVVLNYLKVATNMYKDYLAKHPELKLKLTDTYFGMSNSLKAYSGIYKGLLDPVLMGKRADFEHSFKEKVFANSALKEKYGHLWNDLHNTLTEISKVYPKQIAYSPDRFGSKLFSNAMEVVDLANTLKLPVDQRPDELKTQDGIDKAIAKLDLGKDYYPEIEQRLVQFVLENTYNSGFRYLPVVNTMTNADDAVAASKRMVANTFLDNTVEIKNMFAKGADVVLVSDDPFIQYAKMVTDSFNTLRMKIMPLYQAQSAYTQEMGKALYEVYGTAIPPDANFTLRIADGVVEPYDYNGTTAPAFTTMFGLYDRYYSYGRKDPWDLPAKWANPPANLNMATKMDFVSTNDIIGGNSGSAMINKNKEVVGLVFDGNIESLPGRYIYDVQSGNRTVSVHSSAILESLDKIYKATRIVDELKNSKIK
jgi:hypothetical protein